MLTSSHFAKSVNSKDVGDDDDDEEDDDEEER